MALSAACTKILNAFNPFGTIRKKFLLCKRTKKARYVRSLRKKPHFGAFPEAKKANWCSQLHAQSSKMHSIPLGPSEKNSFVQKHKEGAICAILREKKPHFGAFPEAKKGFVNCAWLPTGPIIMQISRNYKKKNFIV